MGGAFTFPDWKSYDVREGEEKDSKGIFYAGNSEVWIKIGKTAISDAIIFMSWKSGSFKWILPENICSSDIFVLFGGCFLDYILCKAIYEEVVVKM